MLCLKCPRRTILLFPGLPKPDQVKGLQQNLGFHSFCRGSAARGGEPQRKAARWSPAGPARRRAGEPSATAKGGCCYRGPGRHRRERRLRGAAQRTLLFLLLCGTYRKTLAWRIRSAPRCPAPADWNPTAFQGARLPGPPVPHQTTTKATP